MRLRYLRSDLGSVTGCESDFELQIEAGELQVEIQMWALRSNSTTGLTVHHNLQTYLVPMYATIYEVRRLTTAVFPQHSVRTTGQCDDSLYQLLGLLQLAQACILKACSDIQPIPHAWVARGNSKRAFTYLA